VNAVLETGLTWVVDVCLGYLLLVACLYTILVVVSALDNALRVRQTRAEDFRTLALSRFTVPVSVVVAAYNEEALIRESVRSLLALDYPEHERVVGRAIVDDDHLVFGIVEGGATGRTHGSAPPRCTPPRRR